MARALVREIKEAPRNYLINGHMVIRQRYTLVSGTINTTPTYRVHDRWLTYIGNAGHFSSAAQGPTLITDPTDGSTIDALNFNANASNVAAQGFVAQRIESYNARNLVGKVSSLSFLIRNDNFSSVTVRMYYANSQDNFGAVTQFYASSTQVLTVSSAVKVVKFENISIPTSATNGILVEIVYSGFSVGVSADTALSKVMLSEGVQAAPTFRLFTGEHNAEFNTCLRYCQVRTGGTSFSGRVTMPLLPDMRVTPSVTVISSGGVSLTTDSTFTNAWTHTKDANNNTYTVLFNAEL